MALGGLSKGKRKAKDEVIQGAKVKATSEKKASTKHKCLFSLDEKHKAIIDKTSFLPDDFRATKSDVIAAALEHFDKLSKPNKIEALRKIVESD